MNSIFFDGTWRASQDHIEVVSPFSGELIAKVGCATSNDVEHAVNSAMRGAQVMRCMSTGKRAAILATAARLVEASLDEFASSIASEMGKPIKAARLEVMRCINTLNLASQEATRLTGETIAFDSFDFDVGRRGYYHYEPLGVVVAITPFNDPLNLAAHKLAPALAAGNSVILKPASKAPLTTLKLVRVLLDAGIPDDALAVLTGHGSEFVDDLVGHSNVAFVSFTGGTKTGRSLSQAMGLKRCSMELGSNGPVIVMEDTDIEKAAAACVSGSFWASGQNCIGAQRIFVQRSVYSEFREAFIRHTLALKVGDPLDPSTDVGPLISNAESQRVLNWVEEAKHRGATVLTGGSLSGVVVCPTVLEKTPLDTKIVCEEVFGPVVSLFEFDQLDEAIDAANRYDSSIHAAIFTQNLDVANEASLRLMAAGVMINESTDYRLDAMPFGGYNKGNLGREGVRFAMREMSQTKVVCYHTL